MPTHFFHSGMTGAPSNTNAAGSSLAIFDACLNTGFNLLSVQSASVTANAMTLNYASAHGYESLALLRLDGAAGGSIVRRCTVTGANTLTIPVTGFANGAVAGTLSTRVAPADWERVFSGTNAGVFRSKIVGAGSSRMYYRLVDNFGTSSFFVIRGFETMTDVNSGTGLFPTLAQAAGDGPGHTRRNGATAAPWFVIADQRTCYFGFADTQFTNSSNGFFGDIRPYNASDIFNGCIFVTSNAAVARLSSTVSSESFCARRANGLGTADIVCGTIPFGTNSGGTRVYPSPITGAMAFARPVLSIEGGTHSTDSIRGERRGLMHCSSYPFSASQQFLVFDVVQGVTGRVVIVRESASTCLAFPVDEDWA